MTFMLGLITGVFYTTAAAVAAAVNARCGHGLAKETLAT